MSQLQIFSYMPNARVYKATIAARLCGVELEIRAAPFPELKDWLWDFNARPLTERDKKNDVNKRTGQVGFSSVLFKTDKFLAAHPFGTVPAAFGPNGEVGIFESNSIMRTVARLGNVESGIYGRDPYSASRIDSYLDASLVFARDSQIYLLALGNNVLTQPIYEAANQAFLAYMSAINNSMELGESYLVNNQVTLADICFACEYALFSHERRCGSILSDIAVQPITLDVATRFPKAIKYFETLCGNEAFRIDLEPFLSTDIFKIYFSV